MAITVLVVDDSAFMRQLIKQMLESDPEINVVAVATDGVDALNKIDFFRPQVVTLDLEMPRMDGLTMLAELMRRNPLPVVVVSSIAVEGGEHTLQALELGAVDFVTKPVAMPSQELWQIQDELVLKVKAAAEVRPELIEELPVAEPVPEQAFDDVPSTGIVVVGASTGGPRALRYLLSQIPPDFPWGMIIAQHIPVEFTHSFADRLGALSALKVKVAQENDEVRPGQILIAPSGLQTGVVHKDGKTRIKLEKSDAIYRPSVDYLFNSVAAVYKENTVGVLLTGMGADGAYGLKVIKEAGGITIAEAETSCVIYGMPRVAAEIGAVHYQLPLPEIPKCLSSVLTRFKQKQ
ncbi:MAG: chemotaxis response regulator protein-glutamate methylesterase [Firmicutes bacterium]|nr:chemotaxis response regulator protein-glutamate methylesterase [Bacillota bacterium]